MRLLRWLLKTLRGLPGDASSAPGIDPRAVELSVTRLEPRVVLNASALAALADVDGNDIAEPADSLVEISAGDDANDGEADEFRLTSEGSRFHIDVNGERVHSGDIDDVDELILRGSDDADRFVIELEAGTSLPDGLQIEAGDSNALDEVVLRAEAARQVDYEFTDTCDRVLIDGSSLTFDGVESVVDTIAAHSRHFVYANGTDEVSLSDGVRDGYSQLDDWIEFDADVDDLTVRSVGSGHTVIDVHGMDEQFDGDLIVDAGVGSISISGDVTTSGEIDLDGGSITHEGSLTAANIFVEADAGLVVTGDVTAIDGGAIHLLGEDVSLEGEARIDASGAGGGGEILIGGDYLGSNPDVRNALTTHVAENVVITADAIEYGNGGRVIVWSDVTTTALGSGNISARGGEFSGDGGFIETSGKEFLRVGGAANAGADAGDGGTWLLDPTNVTINNGSGAIGGSSVGASSITDALNNNTNVVITADNNISVDAAINYTDTHNVSLTLNAGAQVDIDSSITSTDGQLSIIVEANNIDFRSNPTITSNGGSITFDAANDLDYDSGSINSGGGDVTFDAFDDIDIERTITTGGGDFSSTSSNTTNTESTFQSSAHIDTSGGVAGSGNVTIVTVDTAELGQMTVGGTLSVSTQIGTITDDGVLDVTGVATFTSNGANALGDVTLDADNNFRDEVRIVDAHNVTLRDTDGDIALGASVIRGTLAVTATGGDIIDPDFDGVLNPNGLEVTGQTTLNAVGNIELNHSANDFNVVQVNGGTTVTIHDANDVTLNGFTLGGNVTVQAGAGGVEGDMTLAGALDYSGASNITVTFAAVEAVAVNAAITGTGTGTVGVDFDAGTTITTAATASITTVGGAIDLDAGGNVRNQAAITTAGGQIDITSTAGDVLIDGALTSGTGAVNLTAFRDVLVSQSITTGSGNITSVSGSDAAARFVSTGLIQTTSGSVDISTVAAASLGAMTIGGSGTLTVATETGAIVDTGDLTVGGAATLTAGLAGASTNITLDGNNNFQGAVSVVRGAVVEIHDIGDIELGTVALGTQLTVVSGKTAIGSITTSGALTSAAAANVSFEAQNGGDVTIGADVSLTGGTFISTSLNFDSSSSHIQAGATSITATDATLTGSVALGRMTVSQLDVVTNGAVSDVDASVVDVPIVVTGLTTIDADGVVTLDRADHDFNQIHIDDGYSVVIHDANAIDVTGADFDGSLAIVAGRDGASPGNITVSGAIASTGSASVTLTAGTLALNQGLVDIDQAITTNGGDFTSTGAAFDAAVAHINTGVGSATIDHTGTVSLGQMTLATDVTNTGSLVVTTTGAITGTQALSVAGTTTLTAGDAGTPTNITLTGENQFTGEVSVVCGGEVTLHAGSSITLGSVDFDTSLIVEAGTDGVSQGDITANGAISAKSTAAAASFVGHNSGNVTIAAGVSLMGGAFASSGAGFTGSSVHIQAGTATIDHTATVVLGQMTLSGIGTALDVTAGADAGPGDGGITATAVLSLLISSTTASFTSDVGTSVLLENIGNNLHDLTLTGIGGNLDDVTIRNSNDISLSATTIDGDLVLESTGAISSTECSGCR